MSYVHSILICDKIDTVKPRLFITVLIHPTRCIIDALGVTWCWFSLWKHLVREGASTGGE